MATVCCFTVPDREHHHGKETRGVDLATPAIRHFGLLRRALPWPLYVPLCQIEDITKGRWSGKLDLATPGVTGIGLLCRCLLLSLCVPLC